MPSSVTVAWHSVKCNFKQWNCPNGRTVPSDFVLAVWAGLTAAQAAVCGQLQSSLWAVPAVPSKLVFAFLDASLSSCCHAARVNQVSLQQRHCVVQTHILYAMWGSNSAAMQAEGFRKSITPHIMLSRKLRKAKQMYKVLKLIFTWFFLSVLKRNKNGCNNRRNVMPWETQWLVERSQIGALRPAALLLVQAAWTII